jgi:hypothetical protein
LAAANSKLEFQVIEGLPVLTNSSSGKVFIFGHPLWPIGGESLTPLQTKVFSRFNDTGVVPEFVNIFELDRSPIKLQIKLNETN